MRRAAWQGGPSLSKDVGSFVCVAPPPFQKEAGTSIRHKAEADTKCGAGRSGRLPSYTKMLVSVNGKVLTDG